MICPDTLKARSTFWEATTFPGNVLSPPASLTATVMYFTGLDGRGV